MPSKQKKSTASGETEEVDDEVEETGPKVKASRGNQAGGDSIKEEKSRKKHKSADSTENQEAPEKERKKKEGEKEKDKKKKKKPDDAKAGDVIDNDAGEDEPNNNDPTGDSIRERSELGEEMTEGAKEEKKKKKKKSSVESPEGEEEMGSKDKKSKEGKKKKKSHNDDDDEEPLIGEQEEEDSKKKKKKKAKKGSADSDEDKKKKGKKSKNKQVDYAAIYQKELLDYHTDSSDGYEDEYYKKKGKSRLTGLGVPTGRIWITGFLRDPSALSANSPRNPSVPHLRGIPQ